MLGAANGIISAPNVFNIYNSRKGSEPFLWAVIKSIKRALTPFLVYSEVYHKDISPKNFLDLEASQLLAASQAAWVFGGMGSWNDLGFDGDDQEKYEHLSDELYRLLNESYLMAVNSKAEVDQTPINKNSGSWWKFWK